jgi:hypothetical protein
VSDLRLRHIGDDDYSVIREGRDIGRIRATYHHVKQVQEWSWSITAPLPMAAWCHGSAASFDDVKDAFRTAWEQLLFRADARRDRSLASHTGCAAAALKGVD